MYEINENLLPVTMHLWVLQSEFKGVIWCDFKFSFLFGVLQAVHALIRSLKFQRRKSQNQRDILYKSSNGSFKRPHVYVTMWGDSQNTAQMFTKGSGTIILAVVLLLLPAPCRGDVVLHCETETTLFGLPKEDTTRNQWLCCIYNTVKSKYYSAIYGGLFPEPGRVVYNAVLNKGGFYKLGQIQLCKDSLALRTHSL